jgi:hypothetical protein
MNRNLTQFAEDLRAPLERLQSAMARITTLMSDGHRIAEPAFAKRLEQLEQELAENIERASVIEAEARTRFAMLETYSPEIVSKWTQRRQTAQLHARADLMENSAVAAMELALFAVLEAECAAMRVISARRNTVAVQISRGK